MSINDFVEMNIFLCLICFSICAKMQGFVEEYVFFYAEIQDDHQKWQETSPVVSADTMRVKNYVEIALSRTVPKINALLCFMQKDGRQKLWESNFLQKVASRLSAYTL